MSKSEIVDISIDWEKKIAKEIVFVDGLPGVGKTLFSYLLPTFKRIEKLDWAESIENVCELYQLNKIPLDGASKLISLYTDLILYNQMMGRHSNVRPEDQSSIFSYPNPKEYFERFFLKGDAEVLPIIKQEKPILNIAVHHKLPFCKPILTVFGRNAYFLEVIRHPAYMIKQIYTSTMKDLIGNPRYWTVHYNYKGHSLPYWVYGYEEIFLKSNDVERSIHFINEHQKRTDEFKNSKDGKNCNILTICFEDFVLSPDDGLNKITDFLKTSKTEFTDPMLVKQNVPRDQTVESIDLEYYRRVGGSSKLHKGKTEREEVDSRINWVKNNVNKNAYNIFIELCEKYEKKIWEP